MIYLILGLALWVVAHVLKRLVPDVRAKLSYPIMAGLILISLILMVYGYRASDFIAVWNPPSFFGHINNLLMLIAFYVYGASAAKPAKVWIGTKIRHPQLVGFSIWAFAHLIANGDLASILLFGTMLVWAQATIRLCNAQDGPWQVPEQAPAKKEIVLLVITLSLFLVVAAIHSWIGVSPFGGL
jgi:uncharacterized membrane protein